MANAKKAVDISYCQPVVNFEKLKKSVDYVIIQCGYGGNVEKQDDKYWLRNVTECERLDIPYGVYLYGYAKNNRMIESEINHALRLLKGHRPTLPVFYDSEEHGTEQFARTACKKFCDAMVQNGYKAGIYSGEYWFRNYIYDTWGYDLWVAKYSKSAPKLGNTPYCIWQYSSNGVVDGVVGGCDLNYVYKDYTSASELTDINMGVNGMNALFKDKESGNWYWFNGDKVRHITDGSVLEILKKIHKDSTGRDIPCYEFGNGAPWDMRILQAVSASCQTYEHNNMK